LFDDKEIGVSVSYLPEPGQNLTHTTILPEKNGASLFFLQLQIGAMQNSQASSSMTH
jgi:hypothetical protein